jgi:hypothetical protein
MNGGDYARVSERLTENVILHSLGSRLAPLCKKYTCWISAAKIPDPAT